MACIGPVNICPLYCKAAAFTIGAKLGIKPKIQQDIFTGILELNLNTH